MIDPEPPHVPVGRARSGQVPYVGNDGTPGAEVVTVEESDYPVPRAAPIRVRLSPAQCRGAFELGGAKIEVAKLFDLSEEGAEL